jgi:hypothetical protein
MRDWQIRLVYNGSLGGDDEELTAKLSRLEDNLTDYRAAVVGGSDGTTATLAVQAADHQEALAMADGAVRQTARGHGLDPGDVVECHAKSWD